MNYFFLTLFFIFSFASPVWGATETAVKNAGLVPANIWYSKDPFFTGDKVRIYTALFNGSTYDLGGSMEFLDNGVSLGSTSFAVSGGGHVREVWVDWQAVAGSHLITARIVEAHSVGADGKKTPITLENIETGKSERTVDLDPVAKAAQAAEEAKKTEATREAIVAKAENAAKVVSEVTLPVRESTVSGVNVLDSFRASAESQFRQAKDNKAQEIKVIKAYEAAAATSTSKQNVQGATDRMLNVAEKPFAYVLFALYTVLQYIFEWKVIFYGIILYTVYRLIKWVIRKVRDR